MPINRNAAGIAMTVGLLAGGIAYYSWPEERSECEPQTASVMEHFETEDYEGGDHLPGEFAYVEIENFVSENPDLKPKELMDSYISSRTDLIEGLALSFDEGLVPEDWEDQVGNDKQTLLHRVDNLLRVFGEYPHDLLERFEVKHVRIADEYESFVGHFSRKKNEILVEYDAFEESDSIKNLREIIAHELFGHAAHSVYCQENILNDSEFSAANGDFEYIGMYDDDTPTEEIIEKYEQELPKELVTYGPDRMFASPYGATTAAEDFATIAAFTLEIRGIIQPEDADFGSPLQLKQQIILERLDELLPGFRAFAKERSELLRRSPTNEIYTINTREMEIPPETYADPTTYKPSDDYSERLFEEADTFLVLNGAYYLEPLGKGRKGKLYRNPAAYIRPDGDITMLHIPEATTVINDMEDLTLFEGNLPGGDVLVLTREEFEEVSGIILVDDPLADELFANNPALLTPMRHDRPVSVV